MTPPVGTKLYQYAQALVLHPHDKADTTEDVTYFKTVPVQSVQIVRDGVKMDAWEVKFLIFPDQTKLATNTASAYAQLGT